MPIPTKEQNESNEEFIERCMSDEFMKYDDNSQELAVCYAQLEDDEEDKLTFLIREMIKR